jgi:vancomycin permeability regulator SanA
MMAKILFIITGQVINENKFIFFQTYNILLRKKNVFSVHDFIINSNKIQCTAPDIS